MQLSIYLQNSLYFSITSFMKKLIIWCFLLLTSIVSLSFAADLWWYIIKNYDVDMIVNQNGSLDVTEKIDVNFSEPRHGIYRMIPASNQWRPRAIESLSSIWDNYVDQSDSSNYKIRIWDANQTIIWPHQYTISYHVENWIRYINESGQSRQELYRNIIGDDRQTTIDKVNFRVSLFSGVITSWSDIFIYYWNDGDKQTWWAIINWVSPAQIIWNLTTQLLPSQWLTIWVKLPSDYINITPEYEKLRKMNSNLDDKFWSSIPTFVKFMWLMGVWFIVFIIFLLFYIVSNRWKWLWWLKDWNRSSGKPATIEYTPPKWYDLPEIAMFYHYSDNPQIISALIYDWAYKWRVTVNEVKTWFWIFKWYEYHVIETSNNPQWATEFERQILQNFFGTFDQKLDNINLWAQSTYTKVKRIFRSLDKYTETKNRFITQWWLLFSSQKLTPEWKILYEKIRWYMTYLDKVERPVLEQFIKDNPNYIDKILPRAALFGLETKLCEKVKDLLQQPDRYSWTRPFNYMVFNDMNNSFVSASTPPSQSSSWSGFGSSGGWWFSWGGGWWGGGGSW